MSYRGYYELAMTGYPENLCWKCGEPRKPLFPYTDSLYLPCWSCGGGKADFAETTQKTAEYIEAHQKVVQKDKYLQFLLSRPEYLDLALPKRLKDIENVLGSLFKADLEKLGKDTLPILEFVPGAPKELSERNILAIELKFLDPLEIEEEESGATVSLGEGRKIKLMYPEIAEYDPRHHSRHSILNLKSKRTTKRLKLEGSDCIKLWNTRYPEVKSIFKLTDPETQETIDPMCLGKNDLYIIRSAVLKNKGILKRVLDIENEIRRHSEYLSDSVFLLQTGIYLGKVPGETKSLKFNFSWFPGDIRKPGEINLSIL
jgi:hypothetical protein